MKHRVRERTQKEKGTNGEKLSSEDGLPAIERTRGACGGGCGGDEKTRKDGVGNAREEEWRRRLRDAAARRRERSGTERKRGREGEQARRRGKSETEVE